MGAGAIAGIVVAVFVTLGLVAAVVYVVVVKKGSEDGASTTIAVTSTTFSGI